MPPRFLEIFRSAEPARDKFLSRLFALFNEEIVRVWGRNSKARYRYIGRPYLRFHEERYGQTIDFAFESHTKQVLVGELKCELEYEGYRYLTLATCDQVAHHCGRKAFDKFLLAASNPQQLKITVGGVGKRCSGAVLVWGAVSAKGRQAAMQTYGFTDVLALEDIVSDLIEWDDQDYQSLLNRYGTWCNCLFADLRR